jgi:arginyl-tRNA synthetase
VKKIATREGALIKLDEVNKSVDLAWRIVEKKNQDLSSSDKAQIAEAVGVGAIKYNDLSQNRLTDINFNWQKMLSVEGNSGPYLQYTYVRLKSILKKAGKFKHKKFNFKKIAEGDLTLMRKIIQYHDALLKSAQENGPHLLALYLYQLAEAVNSYYHDHPVLKADEPERSLRLELVTMSADILKQGMNTLGLQVVERM